MDSTCVNPKDLKDFEGKLNDDISGKKIAIIDNFLKDEMQEEVRDAITNSIKALEKMELIAPAYADSPFEFEFKPPFSLPSPLLMM